MEGGVAEPCLWSVILNAAKIQRDFAVGFDMIQLDSSLRSE
jgi:hypothetical protein